MRCTWFVSILSRLLPSKKKFGLIPCSGFPKCHPHIGAGPKRALVQILTQKELLPQCSKAFVAHRAMLVSPQICTPALPVESKLSIVSLREPEKELALKNLFP